MVVSSVLSTWTTDGSREHSFHESVISSYLAYLVSSIEKSSPYDSPYDLKRPEYFSLVGLYATHECNKRLIQRKPK
jgi:hypothetical protein